MSAQPDLPFYSNDRQLPLSERLDNFDTESASARLTYARQALIIDGGTALRYAFMFIKEVMKGLSEEALGGYLCQQHDGADRTAG